MPSKKILTPIIPGAVYHIFNRGNNYEKVFFCDNDYNFFLHRAKKFLSPYCEFYAYALLPNHYHFLIQVHENIGSKVFSHQFKNFVVSYTRVINDREGRIGNLFQHYFKRLRVENEAYLFRLLYYIHMNPENHKLIPDFRNYDHSSYRSFFTPFPSLLNRREVLNWFDDLEGFIDFHNMKHDDDLLKSLAME